VGVGRSDGTTTKVARPRPGVREGPRPSEALPRDRDGSRIVPSTVSAASPRICLREDREGQSEGTGQAVDSVKLGGFPSEALRNVRRHDPVHDSPRGATPRFPLPPSRGEAKTIGRRKSPAGGVPWIHRSRASDNPAVLPDARGAHRGDCCAICGVLSDLTIDHILPRSLGGPDTPANRRVLCRRCNSVKGGRIVSDDALRWYRSFERLSRRMGLGLKPPGLGCIGPAPTLNRLAQFAVDRARGLGT
jgi:hypothetical protein